MAEEQKRTVPVMCGIPGGVELRVFAPGYDDGTGLQNRPRVVASAILKGPTAGEPTQTDVDAEVWDAFLKQNEKNPLITSGQVFAAKDGTDGRAG